MHRKLLAKTLGYISGLCLCGWVVIPWLALLAMLSMPYPSRQVVYRFTNFRHLPPHTFRSRIASAAFCPVAVFLESDLSGKLASRDVFHWAESMRYRYSNDEN